MLDGELLKNPQSIVGLLLILHSAAYDDIVVAVTPIVGNALYESLYPLGQWDHYMGINTHSGLGTGYDKEEFLSLVCEPYTEEIFEQYNVAAIHLREYASPTWHEVYAIDGNADGSVSVSMIRHNKWGDPLEEQWIILVQVDKTVTDTQMVNVVIMEQ